MSDRQHAPTLNYRSPTTAGPRPRWRWFTVIAAILVLLLLVPFRAEVRFESISVDAVTGSLQRQTRTTYAGQRPAIVTSSPLELRLVASNIPFKRDWRFLHEYGYDLFGGRVSTSCGNDPPIYQILSVLGDFADASTDDELRAFVAVMQSGTESEQKAAVEAAGEKGLAHLRGGSDPITPSGR